VVGPPPPNLDVGAPNIQYIAFNKQYLCKQKHQFILTNTYEGIFYSINTTCKADRLKHLQYFKLGKWFLQVFKTANIFVNSNISNILAVSLSIDIIARFVSLSSVTVQARNQRPEGGGNPAIALPKFSQTYVFVRYSNKLHHFPPPKISVGCGPVIVDLWNVLISLNLLKLRSAVLRTAVIGKLSLEWPQAHFLWPQAPFPWASAVIFPGGKRRHFAYTFQVADDTMQTDVYKALYPFYTKRNCSILRQ